MRKLIRDPTNRAFIHITRELNQSSVGIHGKLPCKFTEFDCSLRIEKPRLSIICATCDLSKIYAMWAEILVLIVDSQQNTGISFISISLSP